MELKRKCLPLKEYKSLKAMNAFYSLLLGLKMIPGNSHYGFEEFLSIIEGMSTEDQLKTFEQGAKLVPLEEDEVKALICFCTDKNGIPYTAENMKNLSPSDLVEIIVTVCMEIVKNIKVDLVTPAEKKNLETSQLI